MEFNGTFPQGARIWNARGLGPVAVHGDGQLDNSLREYLQLHGSTLLDGRRMEFERRRFLNGPLVGVSCETTDKGTRVVVTMEEILTSKEATRKPLSIRAGVPCEVASIVRLPKAETTVSAQA